jgi:hypothetical protein
MLLQIPFVELKLIFYAVTREEYWHFDLKHVMPFNPKNEKHVLFFTEPRTEAEIYSDTQGGLIDFFKKELKKES